MVVETEAYEGTNDLASRAARSYTAQAVAGPVWAAKKLRFVLKS